MSKWLCLLLFVHGTLCLMSQRRVILSGTVSDGASGETLIGVSVRTDLAGTTTNEYGFYSLALPADDSVTVRFSYVGMQEQQFDLLLKADRRLNIALEVGVQLEEVIVRADAFREQLRSTEMSVEVLNAREAKVLPLLLGESDILKAIQLKPGIPSGAEGTNGLFVRGGGNDQNLIVLDEATVYNASHLFGFFSTFNTDAVKDLKIYKGGFPARYGGRLSSVIDVRLREGNNKTFSGTGGIGLLASRLTLEGPIQPEKSSFIVSGRRTYVDLFTRLVNQARADEENFDPIPNYYFYDLNTKVNFQLGEKDRLYLSGYFGRDVFGFDDEAFDFNFDWGNATGTARWNHVFNPRLFANTTLTFSDYRYGIRNDVTGFSFNLTSQIRDLSLKSDFYFSPDNRHTMRFGGLLIAHQFDVGRLKAGSNDGIVSFSAGRGYRGLEFGAYFEDEVQLSDRLRANAGLRFSGFYNDGTTYLNLEPRFNFVFTASDRLAIKGSYARMNQYLHLVSNSGVALPTDLWYPSTTTIRPQRSDQVALGSSWLFAPQWRLQGEVYYKWLDQQIELVDGGQLFANDDLEREFAIGDGFAYGLELSLEKQEGRLTGWVGYTLAFVRRGNFSPVDPGAQFLQQGYFPPIFDRRHDLSVVGIWEINRRLSATVTFVYGSGDLRWLPPGRFTFQDVAGSNFEAVVPDYRARNNYRLPAYHRLDLGLVIKFFPKWGESDLTLNVINVYDRRNTFFIYLDPVFREVESPDGNVFRIPERIAAKQVSLFPILPAITWNFNF